MKPTATYRYPTYEQLVAAGYTPEPLYIGAAAMRALNETCAPVTPRVATPTDAPPPTPRKRGNKPRTFKSRYAGVTIHRNRWLAQWGSHGKIKGTTHPLTPEGELAAAWDRTWALGLSEPEIRPSSVVICAPPEPSPVLEARGPHKKRLGGSRIA